MRPDLQRYRGSLQLFASEKSANSRSLLGLRQGETALMEKANAWIDANLASGKLNAIYKKYHGTDLPEPMRGRA